MAPDADPDKLIRQAAGAYRTQDERFEVQQADTGWFLTDTSQANEFGQPLMAGPFATLAAVREALPGARKTTAASRAKARPSRRQPTARGKAKAATKAAEPKRTWLDDLPAAEATVARALIRELTAQGIVDAESLVRADRGGLLPTVAARLIERRLEALVEDLPDRGRGPARTLVRRAAEILTSEGVGQRAPLPRWALVEIRPDESDPKARRIVIRA
jgi:hypothetical protein